MGQRPLPWSGSCFVCGDRNPSGLAARFVAEERHVRAEVEVERCFEGYPGSLHGGVITALLDETAGWACTVARQRLCVTVEIRVRFRAPVPGGTPLSVFGEFRGDKGRFLTAASWIEDAGGATLATAEGVFSPIPASAQNDVLPQLKMPGRSATPDDL